MKNIFKLTFVLFSLFILTYTVSADVISDPGFVDVSDHVGWMLVFAGVIIVPVVGVSALIIRKIKKNGDSNNK